jgi:hypothetical protein
VFKAGDNFLVSEEGTLYAKNGVFSGHIEATSGKIGNLSIVEIEDGIGEGMSANVDSEKFSWSFSSRDGMYMWKGSQTSEALLKVDSTGLTVNGIINAT